LFIYLDSLDELVHKSNLKLSIGTDRIFAPEHAEIFDYLESVGRLSDFGLRERGPHWYNATNCGAASVDSLRYFMYDKLSKTGSANLRILKEPYVISPGIAWIARRKNLYSQDLDIVMGRMAEFGILKKIKSKFVRDEVKIKQVAPLEPLNPEHFLLPFVWLIAGLVASCIAFALEIFWTKIKK